MNELTWLLLCALATLRLSELLVIDDGPFDVFFHLRGWAHRQPMSRMRGMLAGILSCVHCAGLWMAVLVGSMYYSRNAILHVVIFVLAVAGLQSLLAGKLGRNS